MTRRKFTTFLSENPLDGNFNLIGDSIFSSKRLISIIKWRFIFICFLFRVQSAHKINITNLDWGKTISAQLLDTFDCFANIP